MYSKSKQLSQKAKAKIDQQKIDLKESLRGLKGLKGDQGIQGIQGEKGLDGVDGDTGMQGEAGPRGLRGPQGEQGPKGTRGEHGKDGTDGEDGRGIVRLQIRSFDLIVTYTDGQKVNLGRVVGDRGPKGDKGRSGGFVSVGSSSSSTVPEDAILYLASIAPSTATYTGDKITLLTYDAFQNITNHTKTLSYTGDELTSTQEIFDYNGQTWTVDITLAYSAGVWQSKSITINKV